jgi:hypothetical protein
LIRVGLLCHHLNIKNNIILKYIFSVKLCFYRYFILSFNSLSRSSHIMSIPAWFNLKLKLNKYLDQKVSRLASWAGFNDILKKLTSIMHKCCIIFMFFNILALKLIGFYFFRIRICFWNDDSRLYKKQILWWFLFL